MGESSDKKAELQSIRATAKENSQLAFMQLFDYAEELLQLEEHAQIILEGQVDLICRYTADCMITYVNGAFCDFYKKKKQDFAGASFIDFIPEAYWGQLDHNVRELSIHNTVIECERLMPRDDGTKVWLQWSERGFFDDSGILIDIQAVGRDITKRKAAEAKIYSMVQRFELLATLLPVGIFQIDSKLNCSYINQHWMMLSEQSFEQAKGQGWLNTFHQEDKEKITQRIEQGIEKDEDVEVDARLKGENDRWVHLVAKPMYEQWGFAGFLVAISDISERKANEQKLAHMVTHDKLTGIGNRVKFQEALSDALCRANRSDALLAVMFLDLDGFKKVNDTLGHHVGDELLIQVSRRLQECIRETDTVARMGGDEFTILLENLMSNEDPTVTAERIITSINAAFLIEGNAVHVSTSIGICVGKTSNYTADELTKYADEAMYAAKTSGKNTFRYHNPEA